MERISEEDAEMLAQKFAEKLQAARSVSDSEHYDHHRWIVSKIDAEQMRALFWEKMLEHVARWGLLGALSAVGYAVWLWLKHEVAK